MAMEIAPVPKPVMASWTASMQARAYDSSISRLPARICCANSCRSPPTLKICGTTEPVTQKSMGRPHSIAAYRSEEHTSELQSLMRISYAVFCLKKKNTSTITTNLITYNYHSTSLTAHITV